MEKPKNSFKIVSDRKARMLLPNMLTLIGVCIGLSSIKFALDEKFELAIVAIVFAALIDGLDGEEGISSIENEQARERVELRYEEVLSEYEEEYSKARTFVESEIEKVLKAHEEN